MELDNRPSDPRVLRDLANSPEVQGECEQVAAKVQRDARRLAPKRTGNLRRHIRVEGYTDLETGIEGFAVGWDDRAWYGWIVENEQPHLVPAAIKHGLTGPGGRG